MCNIKERSIIPAIIVVLLIAACSQIAIESESVTAVTQSSLLPTSNTSMETNPTGIENPTSEAIQETEPGVIPPTAENAADIIVETATSIPCSGILTSPNMEGPYYTPGSPQKDSLIEAGMPGTPVLIKGAVFDQDCQPIAGAKVDFWLADVNGEYDNTGYRLRGHVFSDENGYYQIESIEPGIYTGRPPHIHVKIFAPDGSEILTTQMYFPGSEESSDVAAASDLLVSYLEPDETGRKQVIFNFVVVR